MILEPSTAPSTWEGLRHGPSGSMDRCKYHPTTCLLSKHPPWDWGYRDEPWATERSGEGRWRMVPELRMVGLALGGRVPPPLPLLPVPPPLRVSCREES